MEFRRTVTLPMSAEAVQERALTYWRERGFRFDALGGDEQVGRRGSLWGNLTAFDMSKLRATLMVVSGRGIDAAYAVEFVLRVDTSFQMITPWNRRYWEWEMDRAESWLLRGDKQEAAWAQFERQWRQAARYWVRTGGGDMPQGGAQQSPLQARQKRNLRLVLPFFPLFMLPFLAFTLGLSNVRDTSLLKAVQAGDMPRAARLLARGANIETRDRSKWNSDNPHDWDEAEFTPLAYAIEYRDAPMIKMLLAHGANVNAKTTPDERFGSQDIILSTTVEAGDLATVRLLLDRGTPVDTRGKAEMTPLMLAAQHNRVDIARLLIARGADVNARDDRGFTVLNFAQVKSRRDHSAVIHLLRSSGAH